jgi:hypothetical protein
MHPYSKKLLRTQPNNNQPSNKMIGLSKRKKKTMLVHIATLGYKEYAFSLLPGRKSHDEW